MVFFISLINNFNICCSIIPWGFSCRCCQRFVNTWERRVGCRHWSVLVWKRGHYVFNSPGDSVTDLLSLLPGCAGSFGLVWGLTDDLTIMTKNLFHVIFKTF